MIWGYPYIRKPPCVLFYVCIFLEQPPKKIIGGEKNKRDKCVSRLVLQWFFTITYLYVKESCYFYNYATFFGALPWSLFCPLVHPRYQQLSEESYQPRLSCCETRCNMRVSLGIGHWTSRSMSKWVFFGGAIQLLLYSAPALVSKSQEHPGKMKA